eukprot:GEMP01119257.1.p1 GENE.GEMP01119257.1~~GEMP01119257.1.p1  ORF type:complete len:105 (-),score=5.72 GEMP01119257.1:189-503(-)
MHFWPNQYFGQTIKLIQIGRTRSNALVALSSTSPPIKMDRYWYFAPHYTKTNSVLLATTDRWDDGNFICCTNSMLGFRVFLINSDDAPGQNIPHCGILVVQQFQ